MIAIIGNSIGIQSMFVSIFAFFNRISDSEIGGSMMTFLATLSNFGSKWPQIFVLAAIEKFTVPAVCSNGLPCDEACMECLPSSHGFYPVSVICIVLGMVYIIPMKSLISQIASLCTDSWSLKSRKQ